MVPFHRSLQEAPGRWRGLGPWQCMFPLDFAVDAIKKWVLKKRKWSQPDPIVVDPFCGRGTALFAAQILGIKAAGCDINPVAWVFSSVRANPYYSKNILEQRAQDIFNSVTRSDRKPQNEFQQYAWSRTTLGFINAARRELDWRRDNCDRTLMAFILHDLHGHRNRSLSNQMRPGIAMAPDYAVRWWKKKSLTPPDIDPLKLISKRIEWRYAKGRPRQPRSKVQLGSAPDWLKSTRRRFDFLLTSPPYRGVADYQKDQWLRLWMLDQRECSPYGAPGSRHNSLDHYENLLRETFSAACRRASPKAIFLVRSDLRAATRDPLTRILLETLSHQWAGYESEVISNSLKPLNAFGKNKVKEVDLLFLPEGSSIRAPRQFNRISKS